MARSRLHQCGLGAASFAAQNHQDPRQLFDRRGGTQVVVSRHQERRRPLAAAGRMDCRDGAVRHPLRRAVSRNGALMIANDITAPTMIAWTEPSPSSPAPAARRCAAARRDLAGASEPLEGRARSLLKMAARPAGCGNAGRPPDAGGERRPQALKRNYNSAPSSNKA